MNHPEYIDALKVVNDFNEGRIDPTDNPEYLRGQCELIADLFGVPGVDTGTRIEQIKSDLINIEDVEAEDRSEKLAEAGAGLSAALRKLYRLCDGDEIGVGEVEIECHHVARLTYLDYESYPEGS